MTLLAEFRVPAGGFPLGRVFEQWPGVTLELDRVVPTGDTVMPYFWVHFHGDTTDFVAVEKLFDGLPEIRSAMLIEDLGSRGLFRAVWHPEYMGIMRAIPATELTVVSATGSNEGWTFELRGKNGEQFSKFRELCHGDDIEIELTRLHHLSEMTTASEYELTPEQEEALLLAFEEGYYDDNGGKSMETLAKTLGISRQAFSSRLRRGYRNLIENTIFDQNNDRGS